MVAYASNAAEELREAVERVQNLSVEIGEDLDAYQDRHAG